MQRKKILIVLSVLVFVTLAWMVCAPRVQAQDRGNQRRGQRSERVSPRGDRGGNRGGTHRVAPRQESRRNDRSDHRRVEPRRDGRRSDVERRHPRPRVDRRFGNGPNDAYHWRHYNWRQYQRRWFPRQYGYSGYALRWHLYGDVWLTPNMRIHVRRYLDGIYGEWVDVYWPFPYEPQRGCNVYWLPVDRYLSEDGWEYDNYEQVVVCYRRE